MESPNLHALRRGDPAVWEQAFRWLWPAACGAAALKLGGDPLHEAEDVALTAMETLVIRLKSCAWVNNPDRLRALLLSIVHDEAVNHWRRRAAAKRGGGAIESLDERLEHGIEPEGGRRPDEEVAALDRAKFLVRLQQELKPQQREVLADFYLRELSYTEISQKHGIAVNSVGVYLKRGIESLRQLLRRRPELRDEARALVRLSLWMIIPFLK